MILASLSVQTNVPIKIRPSVISIFMYLLIQLINLTFLRSFLSFEEIPLLVAGKVKSSALRFSESCKRISGFRRETTGRIRDLREGILGTQIENLRSYFRGEDLRVIITEHYCTVVRG